MNSTGKPAITTAIAQNEVPDPDCDGEPDEESDGDGAPDLVKASATAVLAATNSSLVMAPLP